MKTIVMNTLSGAVTEYDWSLTSIGPTRAGSAAGLHALGGNTDAGLPIAASITTGNRLWGDTIKKFVAYVYFAMVGTGLGRARVETRSQTYAYEFPVQAGGVSRAVTGRGIRENYLAFGFDNVAGADFRIDVIEPKSATSSTRRI